MNYEDFESHPVWTDESDSRVKYCTVEIDYVLSETLGLGYVNNGIRSGEGDYKVAVL